MGDVGPVTPSESSDKIDDSSTSGTFSGTLEPDLALVVEAWHLLPPETKATISGMIRGAMAAE